MVSCVTHDDKFLIYQPKLDVIILDDHEQGVPKGEGRFFVSAEVKSVSTASNNYRKWCQREFNFEKSVDTWLTRQGEFWQRKIPNSLIFRVRDFGLGCPEQESNLHTSRYTHLKRTRLPIPPSGLGDCAQDKSRTCMP